jgi:transcriptional regulator with XRE-family HTH domain
MPRRSSDSVVAFDLKADRKMRKLSQQQVAEILFVGQSTVARWEIDGSMPQAARRLWELYWIVVTNPIRSDDSESKAHSDDKNKNGRSRSSRRKGSAGLRARKNVERSRIERNDSASDTGSDNSSAVGRESDDNTVAESD